MTLVVFTGGARSGKSSAAEAMALEMQVRGASVTVAVFGHSAGGEDAEYSERIARHRADRPRGFSTCEYSAGLDWLAAEEGGLLLVDCLGTLLGRIMEEEWGRKEQESRLLDADPARLPDGFEAACRVRLDEIVTALCRREGDTIVVTNEVGDGVVPEYASGRTFRDLLGRANRALIGRADAAYLTVAGRLVDLTALPRAVHWPTD